MYTFFKILARLAIPFYFSSIEVNGKSNIPKEGRPIILAPNHQNSFLDAIVLAVYFKHPIYFLARASVFKGVFNTFLRAIHMRPVFRIRDGYENLSKNSKVFDECTQLLKDRKSLLVFPEANHGEEYYLRPLSRGIPRMVCQAYMKENVDVEIIPVGINYTDHFFSGGKVFLNFGVPIKASDFIENQKSSGYNLNKIRSATKAGLSRLMLIPEQDAQYNIKKAFVKMEGAKYNYIELMNQLNAGNLKIEKGNTVLKWLSRLLTVPNLPFYVLVWWVLRKMVPSQIFHSSIKFAAIMLISWLWICIVFLTIYILKGFYLAVIVLVVLVSIAYIRTKCVSNARFYSPLVK